MAELPWLKACSFDCVNLARVSLFSFIQVLYDNCMSHFHGLDDFDDMRVRLFEKFVLG